MSAAEARRLRLRGMHNARDLGGLRTHEGHTVRSGRLYRAEVLTYAGSNGIYAAWDDGNAPALAALGVHTVIDLRGSAEATTTPSAWAEATGAARTLGYPIDDGGHGAARDYVHLLLTHQMDAFLAENLGAHYIAVLESRATTFGEAVAAIAEGAPVLVHCTEGKDRTGILVALALGAVGVPMDAIVDDYALTDQWRPDRALAYAPHFEAAGVPLESFRMLYESPPLAMRMALDHLIAKYGSVAQYLSVRGAVSAGTMEKLRVALLEDANGPGRLP